MMQRHELALLGDAPRRRLQGRQERKNALPCFSILYTPHRRYSLCVSTTSAVNFVKERLFQHRRHTGCTQEAELGLNNGLHTALQPAADCGNKKESTYGNRSHVEVSRRLLMAVVAALFVYFEGDKIACTLARQKECGATGVAENGVKCFSEYDRVHAGHKQNLGYSSQAAGKPYSTWMSIHMVKPSKVNPKDVRSTSLSQKSAKVQALGSLWNKVDENSLFTRSRPGNKYSGCVYHSIHTAASKSRLLTAGGMTRELSHIICEAKPMANGNEIANAQTVGINQKRRLSDNPKKRSGYERDSKIESHGEKKRERFRKDRSDSSREAEGAEKVISGRGIDEETSTRCAQSLRDAVNGAISLIAGSHLLVEHLLRLWSSVPYVPMLVCPSSLFAHSPALPWPESGKLRRGDLLRDVLEKGYLIVAGVGGVSLTEGDVQFVMAKDRGDEGNYNSPEPTGFFPDYLRAIVDTIGQQYDTPLQIRWLFYPSVEAAQRAVLRGEAHMTDIYFMLAQFTPGEPQPLVHFYATCPVVGSPVFMVVREEEGDRGQEVTDLLMLNKRVDTAKTDNDRRVVFVSVELATTIQHTLSPFTIVAFASDMEKAVQMVLRGEAVALLATGVLPALPATLRAVSAEMLLGKGAWIERTYSVECVEDEHGYNLDAYAMKRSPDEALRVYGVSTRTSNALAMWRQHGGISLALGILYFAVFA